MKKLLVLVIAIILVLSLTAVSMAAVTVSGFLRYNLDSSTGTFNNGYSRVGINVDDVVNDQLTIHAQIRNESAAAKWYDSNVTTGSTTFLNDYYATIKQSFGTFKIGQWENDFWGDVDVFDPDNDSLWMTPCAIEFAPKLSGGFTAAIWYNPVLAKDADISKPVNQDCQNGAVPVGVPGLGAYTVSVGYAADALSVEAAYGNLGQTNKNVDILLNDNSWTILNVSYKVIDPLKLFVHYDSTGHDIYTNEILGANYAFGKTGFSTQLEYDFAYNNANDKPIGLGLYYSANKMNYTFYYINNVSGKNTYSYELRAQYNF